MGGVDNKQILLEVADEIEKDEKYSGAEWWFPHTKCGCAMTRIIGRAGTYITEEAESSFMPFRIEGFDGGGIGNHIVPGVAYITGISDKVWEQFRRFSLKADRFWTARALREIAETGGFADTSYEFSLLPEPDDEEEEE